MQKVRCVNFRNLIALYSCRVDGSASALRHAANFVDFWWLAFDKHSP